MCTVYSPKYDCKFPPNSMNYLSMQAAPLPASALVNKNYVIDPFSKSKTLLQSKAAFYVISVLQCCPENSQP